MREWLAVPEPESPAALKLLHEAKIYVESLPKGEGQRKLEAKKLTQKNCSQNLRRPTLQFCL